MGAGRLTVACFSHPHKPQAVSDYRVDGKGQSGCKAVAAMQALENQGTTALSAKADSVGDPLMFLLHRLPDTVGECAKSASVQCPTPHSSFELRDLDPMPTSFGRKSLPAPCAHLEC